MFWNIYFHVSALLVPVTIFARLSKETHFRLNKSLYYRKNIPIYSEKNHPLHFNCKKIGDD